LDVDASEPLAIPFETQAKEPNLGEYRALIWEEIRRYPSGGAEGGVADSGGN
jgi:hypothetical protein